MAFSKLNPVSTECSTRLGSYENNARSCRLQRFLYLPHSMPEALQSKVIQYQLSTYLVDLSRNLGGSVSG